MDMSKLNHDLLMRQGFLEAHKITKKFAKAFYFASFFLTAKKRRAVYSIYALCRISDESVDDFANLSDPAALNGVARKIDSAYSGVELKEPLLLAFRKTIEEYQLPKEYFDELIKGMGMDLTKKRYANFDELYSYCYKAAGVIGLIMLKIFGSGAQRAEKSAISLGVAMQLTNIIRDIPEDFARGRVYLPQDEIKSFNLSEKDILEHNINDNCKALLKFQSERARGYYRDAQNGIGYIGDLRSRVVALAIKELYSGILDLIEKRDFDVFSERAALGFLKKIGCLLRAVIIGYRQ